MRNFIYIDDVQYCQRMLGYFEYVILMIIDSNLYLKRMLGPLNGFGIGEFAIFLKKKKGNFN